MSQEFAAGAVQISTVLTASTLAAALTAAVLVAMPAIVWAAWGDAPAPSNP